MRKALVIILGAAALAVLSCTKVERTGDAVPDAKVSYQVVQTKATSTYPTDVPFVSSAFLLPEGKTWSADRADAQVYIDQAVISYDASGQLLNGTQFAPDSWHDATTVWYWPKTGSLSFTAYSPASLKDRVTVTGSGEYAGDITISGYDTARTPAEGGQKGIDFLVTDTATDKKANEASYGRNGVPTLFRHQLTRISFLGYLEQEPKDDWQVKIYKITLKGISCTADYAKGRWDNWAAGEDVTIYDAGDGRTESDGIALDLTARTIGETLYMLPQYLTGKEVSIVYRKKDSATEPTADETASFKFEQIQSYYWEAGKDVHYTFSFGNSDLPIEFGGSVGEWTEYGNSDITIGGSTQ